MDRFYERHSISLDFGRGPNDEYRIISKLMREKGFRAGNDSVRKCMEFVRSVAIEANKVSASEIRQIDAITKQNRIVGGIIPTDVTIGYELLKQALELTSAGIGVGTFCFVAAQKIKEKLSKPSVNDATASIQKHMINVVEKLTKDDTSSKIIASQYEEMKLSILGKELIKKQTKKHTSVSRKNTSGTRKTRLRKKSRQRK